MASEVGICNRALQKVGAKRITSLTDDSVNARACNVCYTVLRDAELEDHPWNFAKARAQLAADATAPAFGKANSFPLPSDFLALRSSADDGSTLDKDWEIEGRSLLTNDSAPLNLLYIKRITDPNLMDPLFQEALACRIAIEICEELTQSNGKKAGLKADYDDIISRAKRRNAIQNRPKAAPDASWISERG